MCGCTLAINWQNSKIHINILSLNVDIAKSFRGLLFLTLYIVVVVAVAAAAAAQYCHLSVQ